MTETEWEDLRRLLCQHFGEDIVQQVLLELLVMQGKGVKVLHPLHWCRQRAKKRTMNERRRAAIEREGRETLTALRIPYDNRTPGQQGRARDRRYNRKRKERQAA
jgi:hypothetical protein